MTRDPAATLAPAGRQRRIARAEAQLRRGGMIVLCEPTGAASTADLVLPASAATPDRVNFLITHGHSLLYVCMPADRSEALGLRPLARHDPDRWISAMTTSIEARTGVSTGISAADRARTIQVAGDPASGPDDLSRPGHVLPVAAQPGGLLARRGRTEAIVELLAFAGLFPVAAACELMSEEGVTMGLKQAIAFAERHELPCVSVEDVVARRFEAEPLVKGDERLLESPRYGALLETAVASLDGRAVHRAIRRPSARLEQVTRVHAHVACVAGDVFGACPEGCGERLAAAMADVVERDDALLIYLASPATGLGHARDVDVTASTVAQALRTLGAGRGQAVDPALAARVRAFGAGGAFA